MEALGKKAGLTKQSIGALELARDHALTGKPVRPKVETVDALAKALDANIDEARLAAGYAPVTSYDEQTQSIETFFRFLASYGIDGAEMMGGIDNITPERFEEIKHDFDTILKVNASKPRFTYIGERQFDMTEPAEQGDTTEADSVRKFTRIKKAR